MTIISRKKIALLEDLLRQGQDKSEFFIDDIAGSAVAIHMATLLFHMPMMMPMYTLKELEDRAKTLCQIIVNGLQQKDKVI